MSRHTNYIVSLLAIMMTTSVGSSQGPVTASAQASGYWEFVESFIDPYPPLEKRSKTLLAELKWAPRQLTTRVGNLVGAGGNIQKEPVAERTDVWTWTTPPRILVPGDKHAIRLSYSLIAMRGVGPESTMSAGFVLAAPRDQEPYLVNNASSKSYGNGVVGPNDFFRLFNTREPRTLDGTVIVPKLGYADSGKSRLVDFAVLIAPGQSFTRTINYRYKWVDGTPPPMDQRRGAVRDPSEGPESSATADTPTPGGGKTATPPAATPEPATTTRFTVQAGVRRAKPGEVVRVPIYVLNPGGVANLNTTISYTSSVVAADGKPLRGNVLGSALFEANAAEAGIARVGFAGAKPVSDSGILAHIAFKAVGKPGDRTILKVEVTTANGTDGKSLTADTIDGEVLVVGEDGKVPGDHDGDGEITAGDALSALKMSVKLIDEDLNLDLDKDSKVTSNDARLILLKVVGK